MVSLNFQGFWNVTSSCVRGKIEEQLYFRVWQQKTLSDPTWIGRFASPNPIHTPPQYLTHLSTLSGRLVLASLCVIPCQYVWSFINAADTSFFRPAGTVVSTPGCDPKTQFLHTWMLGSLQAHPKGVMTFRRHYTTTVTTVRKRSHIWLRRYHIKSCLHLYRSVCRGMRWESNHFKFWGSLRYRSYLKNLWPKSFAPELCKTLLDIEFLLNYQGQTKSSVTRLVSYVISTSVSLSLWIGQLELCHWFVWLEHVALTTWQSVHSLWCLYFLTFMTSLARDKLQRLVIHLRDALFTCITGTVRVLNNWKRPDHTPSHV
jgi:hypothetical protein